MKIRKVKLSDLRSCSKFFKLAYSEPPFNEKWQGDNAYKYLLGKFKYYYKNSYVLIDKDVILGFIFVSLGCWTSGPQAVIEEIVIDPKHHHRGFGSLLMEHAAAKLKKIKVKSILLWTNKNSLAYKFHQKHGFSLADDLVIMHKNNN